MAPQSRTCQTAACSKRVPAGLAGYGVCLSHYLDDAFTRVAKTIELCKQGQPIDSATLDWLIEQGDFAVRMLSRRDPGEPLEQRAKMLELLLCLANAQEYIRHHSISKPT